MAHCIGHAQAVHEDLLHDPPDVTESTEMYIGRGSFGLFRNVKVSPTHY